MSRFKATLAYFETDLVILNCRYMKKTSELATPSLDFHTTPEEGSFAPTYDLTCNKLTYTAGLQWNRISYLESYNSEAKTLALSHRDYLCNKLCSCSEQIIQHYLSD
ncbi:hypothetical protein AVEN_142524-1 [Araneus ventricosus]|uniref:Uncharacterized protein n=1 Tax=Araneus ventricosus TaxID=182803 RepID=A0A4Y2CH61_ARAVE|nr:hypothetical protein AVEN_142524-1 [Araneus ventricosus]